MDARYFSKTIVKWYQQNMRELPWRTTKDPYKIWLSEIILQQTRVLQGLPYYEKFIIEFPDVRSLAAAPEQKVLRLWQGLGYYTRARNLHACAKVVVQKLDGLFPDTYEALKGLPGIGEYTAAAIASIAHEENVAVVDGNVFRVLARLTGTATPINTPEGKKEFTILANSLMGSRHPAEHNQAVMEFGALRCTPKNPHCAGCIFASECVAYNNDLQAILPVKLQKKKSRKRYFYYFIIKTGKSLVMNIRTGKDIWRGLYDFYLVEKSRPTKAEKILEDDDFLGEVKSRCSVISVTGAYKHLLSHQTIITRFVIMESPKKPISLPKTLKLYSITKVKELPKPVLVTRVLADHKLL